MIRTAAGFFIKFIETFKIESINNCVNYRVETAEGCGPGSGNHETDLRKYLSSAPSAFGTHIDDVIRQFDNVQVMFDNQNGIAVP